jgi:protein SCO1/2
MISCLVTALSLLVARGEPITNNCCRAALPNCCAKSQAPMECTEKSLYQVESTWTTDEGRQIKLNALRGKPQVIAMFFANCQYTCPITISDLKRIAAAVPENLRNRVGFTLVSFDSERDTPQVLRKIRKERGLDADNWTVLRGEPDDTRELAALLGVNYRKDASGQFAHSNLITVLNGEGEIVLQQPGLNLPPDKVIEALKSLCRK